VLEKRWDVETSDGNYVIRRVRCECAPKITNFYFSVTYENTYPITEVGHFKTMAEALLEIMNYNELTTIVLTVEDV